MQTNNHSLDFAQTPKQSYTRTDTDERTIAKEKIFLLWMPVMN